MEKNFTLFDFYRYVSEIKQLAFEPSGVKETDARPGAAALRNIMNYSASLAVFKTRSAGNVNVLMN